MPAFAARSKRAPHETGEITVSIEALAFAKQIDLGAVESATARLIIYVIAENTFNDTFVCRLCQEQIAYEAGRIGERTLRRYLAELETAGVILRPGSRNGRGKRLGRRVTGGHFSSDQIRLVGLKRWYFRDHAAKQRRVRAQPAAKLAAGETAATSGQIGRWPAATCRPLASGQQVAGAYKDTRTSTSRTSPPQTPTPSTADAQAASAGGREDFSKGWHRNWTEAARDAVDELRDSADDRVADVATVFLARVRGMLVPPLGVDAVAYVRQLGARLRVFDAETLARLADQQIGSRHRDLDSVAHLEEAARGEGKAAQRSAAAGVQISRNPQSPQGTFKPDAVAAWIAYGAAATGRTEADRAVRFIAANLERFGVWVVPSAYPPGHAAPPAAQSSTEAA